MENIEVLCHSAIRFSENKIIYFDPYKINKNYNDADYIFVTHDHYDHFSEEDILKVKKDETKIIVPNDLLEKSKKLGFDKENILTVIPNSSYKIDDITFETIPAYNVNKNFHPRANNWIGYIINLNNTIYYIAGDTDITEENRKVKCDVAFVPIGGTYTMTAKEAATLVNEIKPKIAVPIHYGLIVGTKEDATTFKNSLNNDIKCEILIK